MSFEGFTGADGHCRPVLRGSGVGAGGDREEPSDASAQEARLGGQV